MLDALLTASASTGPGQVSRAELAVVQTWVNALQTLRNAPHAINRAASRVFFDNPTTSQNEDRV
jgi:hypothetical protein